MTSSLRFAGKKDLVKNSRSFPARADPGERGMDRGKLPLAQAILRSERQYYGFKMIDRTLTDAVHRNLCRH
jgi:hypothetical protein